jgi:hypothetical protein
MSASVSRAGLTRSHQRGLFGTREASRSESVQNTNDGGISRQNSSCYHQEHCEKEHKST